MRVSTARRARALILGFLPPLALMIAVRVAFAEAYRIPSGSMIPTLLVGDWLFVNKLRFGPHIPFTKVNLPGYAEPRRGDVVVFASPPQDPAIRISPDEVTPTLVKRIVGAPGDTLFMRGGVLFVNGTASPATSGPAVASGESSAQPSPLFRWQHLIETNASRFGAAPAQPTPHDWGPLIVPPREFFMLGDNRDDSIDSRYYGIVPRENIRGAPMFVYYSYDTEDGLDYFRAITEIRWARLGHWIR
jgi:signal peptidase I